MATDAIAPARTGIGIGWQLGNMSGWGVYGTNLALQLLRSSTYQPLALVASGPNAFGPIQLALLQPIFSQQPRISQLLAQNPGQQLSCSFVVLRALGNQFATSPDIQRISGTKNIGVVFFEDTALSPDHLKIARSYDAMVTGSTWNADVLRRAGLTHVRNVLQGIDPTICHPAPPSNLLSQRFVIFSGGKLEYRKGQDLVVAAFRAFHARHPEALLVTAWHNFWPQTMAGLDHAGHVVGVPGVDAQGRLQLGSWLVKNSVPAGSFVDCGPVPHATMGQILREADVALFTNRCEGGTNLVAMESLACGIPTILSANTGHLDLADPDVCYPLTRQSPVEPLHASHGVDGWGESSIDEVLELLERVYADRQAARERGQRAAQFMLNLTWEKQVPRFLEALSDVL